MLLCNQYGVSSKLQTTLRRLATNTGSVQIGSRSLCYHQCTHVVQCGDGSCDLKLGVADHALAQHVQEDIGRGSRPAAAGVRRLDIGVEEVLVGEGVELQEVELPLQVGYVSAHGGSCHAPPVQHATPKQGHKGNVQFL